MDHSDIYGARVGPSGELRDAAGIPIATALNHQNEPMVSWDGANFVVAWTDERRLGNGLGDIYGARVSPLGTVLAPGEFVISDKPENEWYVSLASCKGSTLVVWWGPDAVHGRIVR